MPRVGLKAIAARLGISTAAVSYAMNGSPGVSEELRQQVLATAEQMGYQPHFAAASLRRRHSRTVAFTKFASEAVERTDPFLATLLTSAAAELKTAGFDTLIHTIDHQAEPRLASLGQLFSAGRVDGAIVSAGRLDQATLQTLAAQEYPVVTLEAAIRLPALPGAGAQYDRGIRDLLAHLVERGRSRIAFLAGDPGEHTARQRLDGYRQGLQAAGMPERPELIGAYAYSFEAAWFAATELLSRPDPPDAIMGATDRMAVAALLAAQALGLRVPADVAITGFDDSEFARYVTPQLTTVRLRSEALGSLAARLLVARLDETLDFSQAHPLLPVELMVRDSG